MRALVLSLLVTALPLAVAAEDMLLTGVVTTRDDGLALPGATVSIEAFTTSTRLSGLTSRRTLPEAIRLMSSRSSISWA